MFYAEILCKLDVFSAKNVAADIAEKMCDSVAGKLEGRVLGTFSSKLCLVGLMQCSDFSHGETNKDSM